MATSPANSGHRADACSRPRPRSRISRRRERRQLPRHVIARRSDEAIQTDRSARSGTLRRIALDQAGLASDWIGHRVSDHGLAGAGQRELGVADAERGIPDQHLLILHGRATLVFDLSAEAIDVRDREFEFLVVRIGAGPGALIALRIHRGGIWWSWA